MGQPLAVALVWHMHQPYYCDDQSRRILLPWVRRRASKDYLHMLEQARAFPKLRTTMNFVPSLLRQLDLAGDSSYVDVHRELALRKAADLNASEVDFLRNFALVADAHQRVARHQPYTELRREVAQTSRLSVDQVRDLQAWSIAAWFAPEELDRSQLLSSLIDKGRNFSENDKSVLDRQQALRVAEVIPHLRQAISDGIVEPMTSPYHHPILPLLISSDAARRSQPGVELPQPEFSFPGDARQQLHRGLDYFFEKIGSRPAGIWSPECAMSPESLQLIADSGNFWTVGDERVLAHSLSGGSMNEISMRDRFRPYRHSGTVIAFRDTSLSNRVGFDYPRMDPAAAINDLRQTLLSIQEQQPEDERWLVTIALDGENCWDFYPENGRQFLPALYQLLTEEPAIESVHIGDFLRRYPAAVADLDNLWSGSWIDADFSTWIGNEDQNQAWRILRQTRELLPPDADAEPEAYAELLIAEASDWFWWFGPHHDSGIDNAWDALFRSHLLNAAQLAGYSPPSGVSAPVLRTAPLGRDVAPLRAVAPQSADDPQWAAAGKAVIGAVFGAMHPASTAVTEIEYGRDAHSLYLRFSDTRGVNRIELQFPSGAALVDDPKLMTMTRLVSRADAEFHLLVHENDRDPQRIPLRGELIIGGPHAGSGKRVALVAAECGPLITYGDLGNLVRETAQELTQAGHQLLVIIPAHRSLELAGFGVRIPQLSVAYRQHQVTVDVLQGALGPDRIPVLAVDSPQYFNREEVYGTVDDGERYLFFAAAASRVLEVTRYEPDVVIGFDWEAAVTAVLAGKANPRAKRLVVRGRTEFVASRELLADAGVELSDIPYDRNELGAWAAYRADMALMTPTAAEIAAAVAKYDGMDQ